MKGEETRKTKQNNKTAILEKLMESIISEEVDSEGIEDLSKNVVNPDDAAELIGRVERIMKRKKNNILILAYHQGIIFKKYKENNRFTSGVAGFRISKATVSFKIGITKFIDDYPKMGKCSISLHFLKNNFRLIKEVCKEHASEFQYYLLEILIMTVWVYTKAKARF